MHTNKIERYKKKLRLSKTQREILVGLLLGDGHLETQNHGRTFRLKIEQSAAHHAYVMWIYEQLKEWVRTSPQKKMQTVQGRTYTKYWFTTLSHAAFRYYAHQFYRRGIKVIPRQIASFLTPRVLTVWFMDDGSVKSRETNGRILNTHGYTRKEVRYLSIVLNQTFNLHTRERYQKDGWQIFVPAMDAHRLYELLTPYILPLFFYKLPQIKGNTESLKSNGGVYKGWLSTDGNGAGRAMA